MRSRAYAGKRRERIREPGRNVIKVRVR
jgi:hypothetical protein